MKRPLKQRLAALLAVEILTIFTYAAVNPAVRPSSRTATDWYSTRHRSICSRVSKGGVDLIFIGDSITHYWETTGKAVWDDYYGDRKAVNMGFRGDRTQNVLWRLDNGELKGISPKVAVILIGTNNTQAGDTPDETGIGIIAVAERVRAKLPNTKILILGIFPCGPSPSYMRTCNVNANALASLRNDGKQIFYLDIGSKFLNSDGKTLSKETMSDYLHPTEKGYEIWAQSIERTLQNWGL